MRKLFSLFCISLLACVSSSARQMTDASEFHPVASEQAQVVSGNARFTVLTPRLVRMEWSEDGKFDACWTYRTWDNHYMYPSPAENSWESKPAKQPSATYPEGGEVFAAKTAIGGGPLLINEGEFTDSFVEELFNGPSGIGPDSNQPRTAVGVTSDKKMIIFVCEGRGMTEGVYGLTTADVANVLLDLGCVEAINLDGGGSSCMLVNGKETIKVSDGSQRAVGSTIMIK